ncbi:MAG: DUF721 domain-containing protein [Pseudomonadota bacterium]
MSASSLADLLARQLPPGLAAHARDLLAAQTALDRALPAALAGRVRVTQLDAGTLRLACDSGAVASRLRQQTDRLLADLARQGLAAARVQVGVNPELHARYAPPVEKAGLPAAALEGLAQLNTDLEDGPLKEALGRLLRHHRGPRS